LLLYACFALAAAVAAAAWFGVRPQGVPVRRAVMLGSACALAFITPLSLPAWALLPPFDYVQFPWRFLMLAGLFFAAQLALLSDEAETNWRPTVGRAVGLAVLLLTAIPPLAIGYIGVAKPEARLRFSAGPERTLQEVGSALAPPEYLPKAAREAGWLPFIMRAETLPDAASEPVVVEGEAAVSGFLREGGALRLKGQAVGKAELRLPLFWFPGWSVAGTGGELTPDRATGLVRLTLPAGLFDITVERQPLALTRAAAFASLAVLLGVLALALLPGRPAAAKRYATQLGPARHVRVGAGIRAEP
jgi:hypothetical protein